MIAPAEPTGQVDQLPYHFFGLVGKAHSLSPEISTGYQPHFRAAALSHETLQSIEPAEFTSTVHVLDGDARYSCSTVGSIN